MGDAGLMCRENCLQILGLGKNFVFTLKGNQQRLFELTTQMFQASTSPPRLITEERRNGMTLTRRLDTLVVNDLLGGFGVTGAQEVWRVVQEGRTDFGERTSEVRFFVSSLPPRRLSPSQKLQLVRLHWGIENNRHWGPRTPSSRRTTGNRVSSPDGPSKLPAGSARSRTTSWPP